MINGGIDRIIEKKADANRGNPQRLEQSYARNRELLDLLALQKLKSEKDAAARDLEMKAQQQPGTIAEQLEQEMMQRTKDDMVKQTAGIMEQRKQKAAAQAKQMGQPTPPPQGTGIMGMAPQGARPPMMGQRPMPGFQKGGPVDDDPSLQDLLSSRTLARIDVATIKQAIQAGKLMKADFDAVLASLPAGKNKDEIVEYLMKSHDHTPGIKAVVDSGDPKDIQADTSKPLGVFSQTTVGTRPPMDDLISGAKKELENAKPGSAEYDRASDKLAVLQGGTGSMSPDQTKRLEQEIKRLESARDIRGADREKGAAIQQEIDRIKKYLGQSVDPQLYYGLSAVGPKPDSPFRTGDDTGAPTGTGTVLRQQTSPQAGGISSAVTPTGSPQADSSTLSAEENAEIDAQIAALPTELDASAMMPQPTDNDGKMVSGSLGGIPDELTKRMGADPEAQRKKTQDRMVKEGKAVSDKQRGLATDYKEFMDKYMTDEQQEKRGKSAFLSGLALGGFRGAGIASNRQKDIERRDAQAIYLKKMGMDEDAIKMDRDFLKNAQTGGLEVYNSVLADKSKAMDSQIALADADRQALDRKLDRDWKQLDATIKNQIEVAKTRLETTFKRSQVERMNMQSLNEERQLIDNANKVIMEAAEKAYPAPLEGASAAEFEQVDKLRKAFILKYQTEAGIPERNELHAMRLNQLTGGKLSLARSSVANTAEKSSDAMSQLRQMMNSQGQAANQP